MDDRTLRTQLVHLLDSKDAHATFDAAVTGMSPRLRGVTPIGWEYSAWQLVEHIRLAQADILAFCVAARYKEKKWPDAYWPRHAAPANAAAWTASLAAIRRDRKAFQALARNPRVDLGAVVPHGTTQTYLREILLAADHTAYHVGQLVALRKALGIWG
jgi:DinB family protein